MAARRISLALLSRRTRIVSGIILMVFAAFHLSNHALGLVSLEAMDAFQDVRTAITRSTLGSIILILAALLHMILGVQKFLQRRTWRISAGELIQLAFGLAIPLLLARHIIGTRIVHELYGIDDNYTYALYVMWPGEAWRQFVLIILVWVHGVIGLHYWLRMRTAYQRFIPLLAGLAAIVPILAFAGFAVGGRTVRVEREFVVTLTQEEIAAIYGAMDVSLMAYGALLVVLIAIRVARDGMMRLRSNIEINYSNGPTLKVMPGPSLLEISHAYGVPHASICGGRGRCSTCRVRVSDTETQPPPADELERRLLDRIGAGDNVRLACQLRPDASMSVTPLLPAERLNAAQLSRLDKYDWGVEQEVTLLFADIRGFTTISENNLAYDVVFLLNIYLARMSEAITDAGGYVDKFMGDGIMAIFGMDCQPEEGAQRALNAARAMSGVLVALNQSMRDEIDEPLRIGIGIHTGSAILARIGGLAKNGASERVTALGDTVNTASRLESASKEFGAQLVVSQSTATTAGIDPPEEAQTITVKGKQEPITVYTYDQALSLPAIAAPAKGVSARLGRQ